MTSGQKSTHLSDFQGSKITLYFAHIIMDRV